MNELQRAFIGVFIFDVDVWVLSLSLVLECPELFWKVIQGWCSRVAVSVTCYNVMV